MTSPETSTHDITVVIDVGTGYMRGGFAGEETPRCEISTEQTQTERECPYPIDRGCVKDWDSVEACLTSIYASLAVHPNSRHALLLTRHVQDPVPEAERFVQLAMEKLGAKAVYLGSQPVLTLYANGCTDGVVLDCGEESRKLYPFFTATP